VRKADKLNTILHRCHEIWELELAGTLWACPGLNGTALYKACWPVRCFYDSHVADQVMPGRISKTEVAAKHEWQGIWKKWSWKNVITL